jgi:hypothetical protein
MMGKVQPAWLRARDVCDPRPISGSENTEPIHSMKVRNVRLASRRDHRQLLEANAKLQGDTNADICNALGAGYHVPVCGGSSSPLGIAAAPLLCSSHAHKQFVPILTTNSKQALFLRTDP